MFAKIIFGGVFKQLARDRSWNSGDRQKPQKQAFVFPLLKRQVLVRAVGFGEAHDLPSQRSADNLKPSPAEVEQHGEQRSEMERNVKCELVSRRQFVPAEQPPHNDEVS